MSASSFKETMSSSERTVAALTGKPYDRIPVNLLISDHAARVIGVTVGAYNNSAELLARGQIAAWRQVRGRQRQYRPRLDRDRRGDRQHHCVP
jgi:uroporphyrinogen decarboxylase